MPAIVEPKSGVRGCKCETPALFPRDELILSAMNHQHRTREVRERREIVEMVPKQKRRSPIRRRKNVQGRKCGLQDEGSERTISRQKANGASAQRLPEAEDTGAIDARVQCNSIKGGIHRGSDGRFGRRPARAAVSRIFDEKHANAPRSEAVERRNPVIDDLAITVAENHDRLKGAIRGRIRRQKQRFNISHRRGQPDYFKCRSLGRLGIDMIFRARINDRGLFEEQPSEEGNVDRRRRTGEIADNSPRGHVS